MSPFITTQHKNKDAARENVLTGSAWLLSWTNGLLLILAGAAIVAYLVLLNLLVSRGYTVKNLEQHLGTLLENQDKLDRELTQLRSSEALALQIPSLGLVEAGNLAYPKPPLAVAEIHRVMIP